MIKFNELFDCSKKNEINKSQKEFKYTIPWIDKYRPTKLCDVVYQDDVVKMLSNILKTGNMPHMLFHGPPGSGKTSTILAISMELFGPKKFKERVIELNASDERGINIVRNKLVTLAKTAVSEKDPNYLCPPYKIIILDEADAMTTEAQSALRKTMEDHSSITRFCFICNYINQIIDPITSRCVKIRFKSINEPIMTEKLQTIAKNENIQITNDAISKISIISNGDMRKGIMILQNLNYLNKPVEIDDVYEIANVVPLHKLSNIIHITIDKNKNTLEIKNLVREFIMNGYPLNLILSQLTDLIIKDTTINDIMKSLICIHISNTEKRLIDGADEYLQLLSIFMCIRTVVLKIDSIYDLR